MLMQMRGEDANRRGVLRHKADLFVFDSKIKPYLVPIMKMTQHIFNKLITDRIGGLLVVVVIIISIITQSPG